MKYAIYDKAADGYLTKMEFEVGYTEHNEYITEAKLLDTPKEAADAIVRIESYKFMEKGRFVIHSFDEKLADQYIISEKGNPTKVIDSITVDLDGNINVKYGTMLTHWYTKFLEYAINRMNALQKAKSPKYSAWCNTFNIYKVIPVTDERSCGHYQFINVTTKGLTEYAKDEVEPLNKCIEELEKANYDLGEQVCARGAVANRLQEENDNLKTKVESIKKETRDWKRMYESAAKHREALKDVIDTIYTDLKSATAYCDKSYRLKAASNAFKRDDVLNCIYMPTELYYIQENEACLTAKDEVCAIIDQILTIMESRELNQSVAFSAAKDVKIAKDIAEKIISICKADDEFEVTLKKFSELYEAVDDPSDDDDTIMHAFKALLLAFSIIDRELEDFAVKIVSWKHKAQKAEKALDDQKKLNETNRATIAQMVVEKRTMSNELSDVVDALESTRKVLTAVTNERDKALERAEKFKGIANSVYGMTIPGRCCGKQVFADVTTGKKILIDKKKYDDLVEYVANINLTYDNMFCMMDKPVYLSTITESLNNLTK